MGRLRNGEVRCRNSVVETMSYKVVIKFLKWIVHKEHMTEKQLKMCD